MKPNVVVDLLDLPCPDLDLGTPLAILVIAIRHHGVEPVVAPIELDHDEDPTLHVRHGTCGPGEEQRNGRAAGQERGRTQAQAKHLAACRVHWGAPSCCSVRRDGEDRSFFTTEAQRAQRKRIQFQIPNSKFRIPGHDPQDAAGPDQHLCCKRPDCCLDSLCVLCVSVVNHPDLLPYQASWNSGQLARRCTDLRRALGLPSRPASRARRRASSPRSPWNSRSIRAAAARSGSIRYSAAQAAGSNGASPFSARPQTTSAAQLVRSRSVALIDPERAADPALDAWWGEEFLALGVTGGRERQGVDPGARDFEHPDEPRAELHRRLHPLAIHGPGIEVPRAEDDLDDRADREVVLLNLIGQGLDQLGAGRAGLADIIAVELAPGTSRLRGARARSGRCPRVPRLRFCRGRSWCRC